MMDLLCEDVQRLIVSNLDSTAQLSKTSKHWKHICETSKVHFPNHVNSTIFTLQGLQKNGPVYMPYVNILDLNYLQFNNCNLDLLTALKALRLHERHNLNLILKICFDVMILPGVQQFLQSLTFSEVHYESILCGNTFTFHTTAIWCLPFAFIHLQCPTLKKLVLLEEDPCSSSYGNEALQKAFCCKHLVDLEVESFLCGTLSLAMNSSLKSLKLGDQRLSYEKNAALLQLACPNLVEFSLQRSNLNRYDLEHFKWQLWPRLKCLDLSKNYNLSFQVWPLGLESLNIMDTCFTIDQLECLDFTSLKVFKADIQTNLKWFSFFLNHCFDTVHLNVRNFLHGRQYLNRVDLVHDFWTCIHAKHLSLGFKDIFYTREILTLIQETCRCHVTIL